MTDQPPNFDDIFEDDDALEKARKNSDGKTIEGDFTDASGAKPDENKVRKGDMIITGTGPGGFGPQADAEEDTEKKPEDSEPDPEDDPRSDPRRRLKVRNAFGMARDAVLAIHDRGDHFRIGPKQANGPGPKEISDKQLREILMRCVLEKGWNKIYFYHGNKFDLGTSQRAARMLSTMMRPPRDEYSPHTAGPLYEAALYWKNKQDVAMEKYKEKVEAYKVSGGEPPGNPPNLGLDVVMGRMEPHLLPKCFNAGHHERLRVREEKMFRRNQDRQANTERFSKWGFS